MITLTEEEYNDRMRRAAKRGHDLALEKAEGEIANAWFMLSLGSPGEGPFTRQDRTVKEVQEQLVERIRALRKME
jgi:hypothetical protein